jgi:hypothetical protein
MSLIKASPTWMANTGIGTAGLSDNDGNTSGPLYLTIRGDLRKPGNVRHFFSIELSRNL